ncbi:ABC transporter substrate-binding protein [Bordetella sp. 02P26C-1]|uniref:ABC transporter substrate-binding protein n=1 Tax=Bordetella sp. 02P26C-1 TaxID=2683195 RepID=UPI001355C554|nr:ABC transporter substrate-binding protein [Bordetella sp. 02P26C-1]MVW78133.1 PhnD/SsuA/transferrin family substrate-binding protein [Bordetella sp. 02P26C-1]
MKRRNFLSLSLLGLGSALPWASARAKNTPAGTKLVIADQSELVHNLLQASGERDKLNLELPNFAGGPAIYEAIRAGALDAAYVGDTPPIQARAAGTLLPIVASFTRDRAQYILTTRPGLTIDKLADLKGKKLSYIEGSGRQVYLIEALNRAGLGLSDVELVHLRVADLPDAIRSGAVDVAVLQEPHVTRLAKQVGASPVRDPQERNILPSTSYFYARPDVLADPAKSAALREFIAAFTRAATWSNANQAEWGKHYYIKFQRISPDDTQTILASQSPLVLQTSEEAIPHHQKLIDILYQAGAIKERFDARLSFVDTYDEIITASR